MSSDVKTYQVGPATRERYDAIIRKATKEAGAAIEAPLDKRYTSKESTDNAYGWTAYERYYLSNGHTLFFSLATETATVSEKPSSIAKRKVEGLLKRQAERNERKAAREKKAADRKAAKEAAAKAPKPVKEAKPKAARKPKVKADA